MTCEYYDISQYIETNILNSKSSSPKPEYLCEELYCRIPACMPKHYIFANNLKAGCLKEVNYMKLIYFVLALRYFKNYQVGVETCNGLFSAEKDKAFYYILLNNKLLAMKSEYGFFYTSRELIAGHEGTLGAYLKKLDEGNFFDQCNQAEKMLLRMWLIHARNHLVTTYEHELALMDKMLEELKGDRILLNQGNESRYFGNSVDHLPAGMNLTVIAYYREMAVSDLFLQNIKVTNEKKYILLDSALLENTALDMDLTVLNHVKYFEIKNRYNDENELRWLLSNEFKIKIAQNYVLLLNTNRFFINKVYKLDKPYLRNMKISGENLILGDSMYLYPVNHSLFEIYDFQLISKNIEINQEEDRLYVKITWPLENIDLVNTYIYTDRAQADISDIDLSIRFFPEYEIKDLEYYEIKYHILPKTFAIYPLHYTEKKENHFITSRFMDIHFIMLNNEICGFFKTEHEKLIEGGRDKAVTVSLKCYPDKITCCYEPDSSDDVRKIPGPVVDGASHPPVHPVNAVHFMYYLLDKNYSYEIPEPQMYSYIGENLTIDELELNYLNAKTGTDIISKYHWNFDGQLPFLVSLMDVEFFIRKIFFDLLTKEYITDNIHWNIEYSSLNVPGALFEHNINELLSKASILKREKFSQIDQYKMDRYLRYNVTYHHRINDMLRMNDRIGEEVIEAKYVYLSDYVMFSETVRMHGRATDGNSDQPPANGAGRHRKHTQWNLTDILMLLWNSGAGLELYGMEGHEAAIDRYDREEFRNLLSKEMESLELDMENELYRNASRDLILVFTLLIVNLLIQHDIEGQKVVYLVMDMDSVLLKIIKKTGQFGGILEIISESVGGIAGAEHVYIRMDDTNEMVGGKIKTDHYGKAGKDHIVNITAGLFREKLLWEYEHRFLLSMQSLIIPSDFFKSLCNLKVFLFQNKKYFKNCISLIKKNTMVDYSKAPPDACRDNGTLYKFIGGKQLLCVDQSGNAKLFSGGNGFFDIVRLGRAGENMSGIMLLPAILKNNAVIEKGMILLMADSAYLEKPEVSAKDFEKLDDEHAQTAAYITNGLLDFLDKSYKDKITGDHQTICQLKEDIDKKGETIGSLEMQINRLYSEIASKEKNLEQLSDANERSRETIKENEIVLEKLFKHSYIRTVLAEFNKFLNSKEKESRFYSKYKRNTVIPDTAEKDRYKFKKVLFSKESMDLFMFDVKGYAVLPNKRNLKDDEYRELLKKFYNMETVSDLQGNLYEISALTFLTKENGTYLLKNKGTIKVCRLGRA
jgi:hypothetical protein